MSYRAPDETRYYGSDYNKYLHEECRRDMTVINIDCLQWDYKKNILRVVESKHSNEGMRHHQRAVLEFLAKVFSYCNKVAKRMNFQVYIVSGEYPYDSLTVYNLIDGTVEHLYGEDVKRFSELELSP